MYVCMYVCIGKGRKINVLCLPEHQHQKLRQEIKSGNFLPPWNNWDKVGKECFLAASQHVPLAASPLPDKKRKQKTENGS